MKELNWLTPAKEIAYNVERILMKKTGLMTEGHVLVDHKKESGIVCIWIIALIENGKNLDWNMEVIGEGETFEEALVELKNGYQSWLVDLED